SRSHVDAERVGDLRKRDVKALGLFPVDGDEELRVAGAIGGEQTGKVFLFALISLAYELLRGLVELLQAVAALVLHFELKSSELSEALDGWGREGNDDGALDRHQLAANAIDNGVG